jgi:hypothetical protein
MRGNFATSFLELTDVGLDFIEGRSGALVLRNPSVQDPFEFKVESDDTWFSILSL